MGKKILLSFFLVGFLYQSAFACKCEMTDNLKVDYENTEMIVRGKVISKGFVTFSNTLNDNGVVSIKKAYSNDSEKLGFLDKDWIIKTELEIIETYKGEQTSNSIVIYTSRLSAACGYLNFEVGKEFIVYLSSTCYFDIRYKKASLNSENYMGYWTNRCTRTKEFDATEARELKVLMKN